MLTSRVMLQQIKNAAQGRNQHKSRTQHTQGLNRNLSNTSQPTTQPNCSTAVAKGPINQLITNQRCFINREKTVAFYRYLFA